MLVIMSPYQQTQQQQPPGTATWDPAHMGPTTVLSNANLTAHLSIYTSKVLCTVGKSSGKWYWEIHIDSGDYFAVGIATSVSPLTAMVGYDGVGTTSSLSYESEARRYQGTWASYGATYAAGATIGVALDMDTHAITFYKNGVSQGVMPSVTIDVGATYYPAISTAGSVITATANFGATTFTYSVPSGFSSFTA